MAKLQVILDDAGHPAFAVLPWREYERLIKGGAEALLSDEEIYDHAKSEEDESFPIEVADQLVAREKRDSSLSQVSRYDPKRVGCGNQHQSGLSLSNRNGKTYWFGEDTCLNRQCFER